MGYKYIIVRKGNQELPFIFPENCVHSLMFRAVRMMTKLEIKTIYPSASEKMLKDAVDSLKVVGAGSITLDVGSATGSSGTLKVQSRPGDASAIQSFPYTHGLIFEGE